MLNLEEKKQISLNFFIFLGLFLLLPLTAKAVNVCDQDTILNFVARDPGGSYIKNVRVDVYKEETDVNGQTKPGARVGGSSTDSVLGRATIKWRDSAVASDTYAIKVQTISKDNASFYYYGFNFSCGETVNVEKTLSGLALTLRKGNGDLLTDVGFGVYTQLKDADGSLLLAKNELLTSPNSGASGQVRVYLPQGTMRGIDNTASDYYVLEINYKGNKFYAYGLNVTDGQMTSFDYTLSALRLRLRDASDKAASGAKIEVYKQESNINSQHEKGSRVGEFTMNEQGYGSIELPTGWYVLGVKGPDGKYQYFWDVNIDEASAHSQTYRTMNLDKSYNTSAFCQKNSNFYLSFKTVAANIIPGLKFELYEQKADADGFPTVGPKIAAGTLDNTGWAVVKFIPDPEKSYMAKVWDKRSDLGEFWFYDVAKFVCGYDRKVTKTVPALKVILRDSQGNLRRNTDFSLYVQQFDADNNPIIPESGLIGNFRTGVSGQAITYVSPYNPYRRNQSGIYALTIKDAGNHVVTFFNINIAADKDYTFVAGTTGLNGVLTDARGRFVADREIRLYEANADSDRRSGSPLVKTKTDASGRFKFEYPTGTYTLVSLDDFNRENNFGNTAIKTSSNYKKLITSAVSFGLSNSQAPDVTNNSLTLYSLAAGEGGAYYRDAQIGTIKITAGHSAVLSLASGPYLAVFGGKNNQEFGRAFYVKNGASQNVTLATNTTYLIDANQAFRLTGAAIVSNNNETAKTKTVKKPAVPLSSRLSGRILLQVEDKGQAWYINPTDGKKYYLGRPSDAFNVMRRVGLGISDKDFAAVEKNPGNWKRLAGKILLKTEDGGKAYYFDPISLHLYYLGRPSDAFNVMRDRGLGAKTDDLNKVSTGVN